MVVEAVALEQGTIASGEAVELDGTIVRVATAEAAVVQPVIDALRRANLTIHAVRPVRQSLEDYFIDAVSDAPSSQVGPSSQEEPSSQGSSFDQGGPA